VTDAACREAASPDEQTVGEERHLAAREAAPVPARQAATVVLLRPARTGVETFLLTRDGRSRFGAGMLVFPGGALDAADAGVALQGRTLGLSLASAFERLHARGCDAPPSPDMAFGLHVAALRELFEEAGVLLGTIGGHTPAAAPASTIERLARARADIQAGRISFAAVVEAADVLLVPERLVHFAHWITPLASPRRFDTRFFAVAVPAEQDAVHCGVETTAGAWMPARDALTRAAQGSLTLMRPTEAVLKALAHFDSVPDALDWARSKQIRTVTPLREAGVWALNVEGDAW